ncbi:MAG: hypothetical protein VKL59_10045 [Nostocaceae cyanobacterium]|nr:hypothetical protein [Nostocaceae cyanobacterium]
MRRRFGNKPLEVTEKIQQDIILNWFVPFLEVWGKLVNGALRVDQRQVFIYTRNQRTSAIAASSAWNVYLDATATAEYLSWWMDIGFSEILTIEQQVKECKNLEVIQVLGLGQLGKDRSALAQRRVAVLRQELLWRHPDIKFIEWKCQAEAPDGAWFIDSRGSNDFCGISALATFGIPYSNLGYLEVLYITLTGRSIEPGKVTIKTPILLQIVDNTVDVDNQDGVLPDGVSPDFERTVSADPDFQAFVDWCTKSEIYQALGRLRSHLRPEQKLCFYFIGDYPLPIRVKVVRACDITIEAGSRWEQTWFKIAQAAKQLVASGATQVRGIKTAIARQIGCSVGLISKDYREPLDKLLQSLLNPVNSTCKNSQLEDELQAEVEAIAENVMPLLVEDEPISMLHELLLWQRCLEPEYWHQIISATSTQIQAKMLSNVLSILPQAWIAELATMVGITNS